VRKIIKKYQSRIAEMYLPLTKAKTYPETEKAERTLKKWFQTAELATEQLTQEDATEKWIIRTSKEHW